MDKLKSFGSSATSKFKEETSALDRNLQDKTQGLKNSVTQNVTNQSQNLRNSTNQYTDKYGMEAKDVAQRAQNVMDDDSFGDYDALDRLTASNKVPAIQGMPAKGGQILKTAATKGQDLASKASNAGDYLNKQVSQQANKIQSTFQPESGIKLMGTKAGALEDDRESDREQKAKSNPTGQSYYQVEGQKGQALQGYKVEGYKSGRLEDDIDDDAKAPKKLQTTLQRFRAGALEDDQEKAAIQYIWVKHRAGALEDDYEEERPKIRLAKNKAGALEDDYDEVRITKKSIRTQKYRASNLLDDYEERSPARMEERNPARQEERVMRAHPPHDDREHELHEREHQRELDELRRKNQRLQDDLAREMQKNRELNSRLQHTPTGSPTKVPPKRPLGSPKAELFNKQSVRSPTGKSSPGSPMKPQETGPQLSLGALIRKNIEEEDRYNYPSMTSPSRFNQSNQSNLNTSTPMEYFSPVKNQRSNRDYPYSPYSPTSSNKPFRDQDLLNIATNSANFQAACLKDSEILFEDDTLVIESKTSYVEGTRNSDPLLKVAFAYTNKTASELKDFSVTYKTIHNVVLDAESTDVIQRLGPNETQIHKLNAVLVGPVSSFGFMIVEYRVNEEPQQRKLHSPIVLTKFAKFFPISSPDFNREKKILQSQYPENYEESPKIRLSQKNATAIKENLLSKMTLLETDDDRSGRFSVYGGHIKIGDISSEALVRFIIENETQLLMIQLNYEDELVDYAKDLVKMFAFQCNEKVIV